MDAEFTIPFLFVRDLRHDLQGYNIQLHIYGSSRRVTPDAARMEGRFSVRGHPRPRDHWLKPEK